MNSLKQGTKEHKAISFLKSKKQSFQHYYAENIYSVFSYHTGYNGYRMSKYNFNVLRPKRGLIHYLHTHHQEGGFSINFLQYKLHIIEYAMFILKK